MCKCWRLVPSGLWEEPAPVTDCKKHICTTDRQRQSRKRQHKHKQRHKYCDKYCHWLQIKIIFIIYRLQSEPFRVGQNNQCMKYSIFSFQTNIAVAKLVEVFPFIFFALFLIVWSWPNFGVVVGQILMVGKKDLWWGDFGHLLMCLVTWWCCGDMFGHLVSFGGGGWWQRGCPSPWWGDVGLAPCQPPIHSGIAPS